MAVPSDWALGRDGRAASGAMGSRRAGGAAGCNPARTDWEGAEVFIAELAPARNCNHREQDPRGSLPSRAARQRARGFDSPPGRIYAPDMAKLFTREDANKLLPRLRQILADVQHAVQELEQLETEAYEARWKVRGNGHNVPEEVFIRQQAAREKATHEISRVHALGCELKDLRAGLIDFPSRREDELVFLCWKLDEPEVGFWHPTDVGFADRRPL
jgi:hypothetical protein